MKTCNDSRNAKDGFSFESPMPACLFLSDEELARQGFKPGSYLKIIAPAKINLFLDVGAKRKDGYHEALSVMHMLSLCDCLYVQCQQGLSADLEAVFTMSCADGLPELEIDAEQNLCVRAVRLLNEELLSEQGGSAAGRGMRLRMHLEKNIPAQAGLGGGSSDAAAALYAAARLLGVHADAFLLEKCARQLGADVPFFLHGACASLTGAGDVFRSALNPMQKCVLLLKPKEGVSTASAYRLFDESPKSAPQDMYMRALGAANAEEVPLYNGLAPAAEQLSGVLLDIRRGLELLPEVEAALLSGSGSATFAFCRSAQCAHSLALEAKQSGLWARVCATFPFGDICSRTSGGSLGG